MIKTPPFSIPKHFPEFRSNSRVAPFLFFWVLVYILAIFQDYISAELRSTGFYWSETMLYNTYWLWFIPLLYGVQVLYKVIASKGIFPKIFLIILTSLILTALHIIVFTQFFVFVSGLLYDNPHRFSRIMESALSNQVYITLISYAFAPLFMNYFKASIANEPPKASIFKDSIMVKKGNKRIKIGVSDIQSIISNRPYSEISVGDKKYLHNHNLKKFEGILNPNIFIRVHRSALVNKKHIVELTSRGNGDYDATLSNGSSIRFSRHYREFWSLFTTTGT